MTLVKGKLKICTTKLDDFSPEPIGNSPFYNRYQEFIRVIHKYLPDLDAERLFAQPLINATANAIDWYVLSTEGEQPAKLVDMPADEYATYSAIKNDIVNRLQAARDRMTTANERAYLDCALKHFSNEYVENVTYCHNGQITFGVWGMQMLKGRIIRHVITDSVQDHRVHNITFLIEGNGRIVGNPTIIRRHGHILSGSKDIPVIEPAPRHKFVAWTPIAPQGKKIEDDVTFTAVVEHGDTYLISFTSSAGGSLDGPQEMERRLGDSVFQGVLPTPMAEPGYQFVGWSPAIDSTTVVNDDTCFTAMFEQIVVPPVIPPVTPPEEPPVEPELHNVRFVAGGLGILPNTYADFTVPHGSIIPMGYIPMVTANKGYEFTGWDRMTDQPITEDTVFNAQYNQAKIPWYKRLWQLKWLRWLLLALLLLLLLLFILLGVRRCTPRAINGVVPIDTIETANGQRDDNGFVKPVTGEDGKLPSADKIIAPVVGEDGKMPNIIKNPKTGERIIANRLFLYLENDSDNVESLAQDFKKVYPDEKYSIIGYDKEIKVLVVQIPEAERNTIRETLNKKIPNHKFIVFDEQIYEINQTESPRQSVLVPRNHTLQHPQQVQGEKGWHINAINLTEGWKTTKGSGVRIAVVDDGIQPGHPMFTGRIKDAYNVFRGDNHLSQGEGHGTHTAGLAAGSAEHLSQGATGVAPEAELIPVQVFDNGECPLSALVGGVMYAIHHDADVVNMSIGPSFPGLNALPPAQQMEIARNNFKNIARLWSRVCKVAADKRCILVFAAGNDDILSAIPPENRNASAIVVTAVDKRRYPTVFTNYGPGSDISAPGKDIFSAFPNNDYKSLDGTSMAAPIVAGTVALMKAVKKDLTTEQARNVLYRTGLDVYGNIPPMVHIPKALDAVRKGEFDRGPEREIKPVPDGETIDGSGGRLPDGGISLPGIDGGIIGVDPETGAIAIIDPSDGEVVGIIDPSTGDIIIPGSGDVINPGGSEIPITGDPGNGGSVPGDAFEVPGESPSRPDAPAVEPAAPTPRINIAELRRRLRELEEQKRNIDREIKDINRQIENN